MSDKADASSSCPIDPAAREAWLEKARQTGEQPPHPLSSISTTLPRVSPIPVPQDPQTRLLKTRPLSQDRETSSIPCANPSLCTKTPNPSSGRPANAEQETGADPKSGKWIYPSEKMFFEAMRRKNYDPQATDMAAIVPIHNAVNEKAWQEIKTWEARFGWIRDANVRCGGPKLLSFSGDSKRLSPRARWNMIWGYREPFDRHDWVVERCPGGQGVEYVIDFYEGKGGAGDGSKGKGINFYLDVRPKLNTWEGWKMRLASWTGLW